LHQRPQAVSKILKKVTTAAEDSSGPQQRAATAELVPQPLSINLMFRLLPDVYRLMISGLFFLKS
jgi:hypothetical protein